MQSTTAIAQAVAMRIARSAAEECDGKSSEGLTEITGTPAEWIQQFSGADAEIHAALTLVLAAPADETRIELLSKILASRMEDNPAWAEQLRDLGIRALQSGMALDLYVGARQRLSAQALDVGLAWAE